MKNTFVKGKTYNFNFIEQFANDNNYLIEECGKFVVGANFIVLIHNDKDICISFILIGGNGKLTQYECIYTDLK